MDPSSGIDHFPTLSFWYGLSYSELDAMPRYAIEAYVEALPRLQAAQEIMLASASMAPHYEDSDRRGYLTRLRFKAQGIESLDEPPPQGEKLPTGEMKTRLAGMGIAVHEAG